MTLGLSRAEGRGACEPGRTLGEGGVLLWRGIQDDGGRCDTDAHVYDAGKFLQDTGEESSRFKKRS